MSVTDQPEGPQSVSLAGDMHDQQRLHGRLGPVSLIFLLLAFNAPLACFIGWLPIVIGYGNGLGAPLTYAAGAILITLFSVGFIKMAAKIEKPGGFYSFITVGLGRDVGLGAAMVALLVYYTIVVSTAAYMGLAMKNLIEGTFSGPAIHWSVYGFGALILVGILGYFRLELSARVLGVVLVLELIMVAVYDVVVVAKGGAEGLSTSFLDPENFLGGSLGLAFLFAATTFAGFEATVVFRHEVRNPERTIPQATYGFLLLVGVMYAITAWVITQALGDSNAVAATAADPTGSVLESVRTYVGTFGYDSMAVLLNTSIFAALLSMHNVTTRYIFNLSRDGVLPRNFAAVHPTQSSPHRASLLMSAVSVIGVAAFLPFNSNINTLYAQIGGVFSYGLMALIMVTSLAVLVYLNRTSPEDYSVWQRVVAPTLALAGFITVVVLGTTKIDSLMAVDKSTGLLVCFGIYVVWFIGFLYARFLKTSKPDVYVTIGRQ